MARNAAAGSYCVPPCVPTTHQRKEQPRQDTIPLLRKLQLLLDARTPHRGRPHLCHLHHARPWPPACSNKMNTMGGVDFGSHKTIMPSQSGRPRNTKGQRQAAPSYLAWKAAGFPQPKQQWFQQYKANRSAMQQQQTQPMMPGTMWGAAPNQRNNMQWTNPMNQWQQQGNKGY